MNKLILVGAGVSAGLALASISGGVAAQEAASDLPPGPGHDKVAATCVVCHPSTQITARRASESEWSEILDRMIGAGAPVTEDERDLVLKYLTTNFGMDEPRAVGARLVTTTSQPREGGPRH